MNDGKKAKEGRGRDIVSDCLYVDAAGKKEVMKKKKKKKRRVGERVRHTHTHTHTEREREIDGHVRGSKESCPTQVQKIEHLLPLRNFSTTSAMYRKRFMCCDSESGGTVMKMMKRTKMKMRKIKKR